MATCFTESIKAVLCLLPVTRDQAMADVYRLLNKKKSFSVEQEKILGYIANYEIF